jgi:hypothetical protein
MRDEAVPLEDRLRVLAEALSAVREAAEVQSMSIDQLTERYGTPDLAAQKLVASIAHVSVDQANRAIRDLQSSFAEFLDPSFFQIGADGVSEINTGVANLVRTFELSVERAQRLQEAFRTFADASGIDAAFQALVGILGVIDQSRGSTGQLNDAMTDLRKTITDVADEVGQVRGAVEDVTGATGAATEAAAGLAAAWGSVAQSTATAAQMAAAAAGASGNCRAPGTFAMPTPTGPSTNPI